MIIGGGKNKKAEKIFFSAFNVEVILEISNLLNHYYLVVDLYDYFSSGKNKKENALHFYIELT